MKKAFKLDGLDCANCAAKLERAVAKIDDVSKASVNFMSSKLVLEAADDKFDSVVEQAKATIRKIEPGVVIKA
ncbi:Cation transport ATPase [Paenibacillus uliginis N3/975]|uniref:Cation transport ATPase n=1 Tax=Paenibacillus uliginis N3/975 TaxID=1313296 RepID=A0A1X7HRA5_9BACL|nr:Cation transport ATPase [Paenibacillus uliginis N3/975]